MYIQRLENTSTWFIDLWVKCTWLSSPKFSTVKFRFQLSFVFQVCFWPPFLPPYYPSRRYYSPAQRGLNSNKYGRTAVGFPGGSLWLVDSYCPRIMVAQSDQGRKFESSGLLGLSRREQALG